MPTHSQQPRNERLVIGITGRIGSGKTSVGKYLNSAYAFQYLRYSQVISEWLAQNPESKSQLQEVGWQVMAGGMQDELNNRLISQVIDGTNAAVDGLRHPIDNERLNKSFTSSFHLLYIDSPEEARWTRLNRNGRYENRSSFKRADSHQVEELIESLRASAQLVIPNEGSLQDLYLAVDRAIRDFR